MQPNDDITIINCEAKLIILENTCMNQKLINTYVFVYHGGEILAFNRNLSTMLNLTDALISVGYNLLGNPFANNFDL